MVWRGFDLTPYILFEEDCANWHKLQKKHVILLMKIYIQTSKKIVMNISLLNIEKSDRGIEAYSTRSIKQKLDYDQIIFAFFEYLINSISK